MFGIGIPELVLIFVVGLVVFGPNQLPELGRTLGKGLREFRKASNALSQSINEPEPKKTGAVSKTNTVAVDNTKAAVATAGVTADRVAVGSAGEELSSDKIEQDKAENEPAVDKVATVTPVEITATPFDAELLKGLPSTPKE